jgi:NitT/TauT family transport system substrate-binding protein
MIRTALHSFLLTLAALAGLSAPAAAEPFRLIVTHLEPPLVPNSVMDLALELGYFEREGVDVELVRVQQTPSAIAAILSGDGEMANVGLDALLQLVARGETGLKAVISPNKSLPFLIAARDNIATPADLVGSSFGIGRPGSLDHSLSTRVLAAAGVDMDDLEVVALGQPEARAQALAAGRIDATTMSIGVWQVLPDKDGLHVLVDADAYFAAAPVVNKVSIVSQAALTERRDEVKAVIRALLRISRDFAAKPGAWATAIAPYQPALSANDLTALDAGFAGSWSVNGGMNAQELTYSANWLAGTEDFAGLAVPELAEWADLTVLDEVLTELGTDPVMDAP